MGDATGGREEGLGLAGRRVRGKLRSSGSGIVSIVPEGEGRVVAG